MVFLFRRNSLFFWRIRIFCWRQNSEDDLANPNVGLIACLQKQPKKSFFLKFSHSPKNTQAHTHVHNTHTRANTSIHIYMLTPSHTHTRTNAHVMSKQDWQNTCSQTVKVTSGSRIFRSVYVCVCLCMCVCVHGCAHKAEKECEDTQLQGTR